MESGAKRHSFNLFEKIEKIENGGIQMIACYNLVTEQGNNK